MNRYAIFYRATVILGLYVAPVAKAATVVWPAVGLGRYSNFSYVIGSQVSPVGDAAIWFELYSGAAPTMSMQTDDMTIGIAHLWFATEYGVAVDSSAMADADYLANLETEEYGPIDVPLNQVFFLGFRLDGSDPPVSYYIYGWAALLWDGTQLTLVDSAAETTGVGIYAGTYDAIPEPTTAGLLLAGLAVLAVRRRRMRRPGG